MVKSTNTVEEAAAALRCGQVAVFPTDTVYGLGVSVEAARSPQALFDIKRRDGEKPVAWLVADASDLDRYGCQVPEYARMLAEAHWPGSLTLVVEASAAVPSAFRSAAGTIGLRMPASTTALALIRAAGCPLATTSANLSGCPAPHGLEDVDATIVAAAGAVVRDDVLERDAASATDCGASSGAPGMLREASSVANGPVSVTSSGIGSAVASGVASTVVDCTAARPKVLREGSIPAAVVYSLAE